MTSLVEIETAIKGLSENDARRLSEWIQEYVADQWDKQIELDFLSGKLDHLIAPAEADISINRVQENNEDSYLDEKNTTFFQYWRKRYCFIERLYKQKPKDYHHECNVLIWSALDALSNVWNDSIGEKYEEQWRCFDAFLGQYGGEVFKRVSLPHVWNRIEQGHTGLGKKQKKLPNDVCEFLRYIGRPQLDYSKLEDIEFSWQPKQQFSRHISDDPLFEELLSEIIREFPTLTKDQNELEIWLTRSRYGSIAYEEMRSKYIHFGKAGKKTHGFCDLSGSDIHPTYVSYRYSSALMMGFSVPFMLSILSQCIEKFEKECREKGQDIDPLSAIEYYFKLLLKQLIIYQYQPILQTDEHIQSIEKTRNNLLKYLKNKVRYQKNYIDANKFLEDKSQEFYWQLRDKILYAKIIVESLPEDIPYSLQNIIKQHWIPNSAIELAGELVECIEDPEDLSTNPKYFQGFGE